MKEYLPNGGTEEEFKTIDPKQYITSDFPPCFVMTAEDEDAGEDTVAKKGKVIDLILPIVSLIIFCVAGMLYTGGFFTKLSDGNANPTYLNFVEAFAGSVASVGLVLGSFAALIITVAFYIIRRVHILP